jgi:hypothetical protein
MGQGSVGEGSKRCLRADERTVEGDCKREALTIGRNGFVPVTGLIIRLACF